VVLILTLGGHTAGIIPGDWRIAMSTISLRLPDSLHEEIRKLAAREHVSINHLATLALAEKVSALETEDYLLGRASRADRKKFARAVAKVRDVPPAEEDVL
jgi:HicB-like protein involved in pilus formation